MEQQRAKLVNSGRLSESELEDVLLLFDDPAFRFMVTTMMAVWGRRPLLI